ncbi:MAG: TerB N-terminal domain-containing protein [Rhodospirillaceae bacterium]|nr:TerB N-terminal domain-containing protein [Rhodospirillaceae bacterium]
MKSSKSKRADGWIPRSENVRVRGRDIGGMIYIGRGSRTRRNGHPDNAFIDTSKTVSRTSNDYEGCGMGYWPSYSEISPRSRATYLDWLSNGRSDTRYNVGYVFLYFYGLERRVFVDKTDSKERADIVAEVHRLLETYGHDRSIRCYLGNFINAASTLDPGNTSRPIFKRAGCKVPANVLLALGRMAANGESLTSDWLLSWYLCHPETRLRTPARRASAEFREYFRYLFDQEFPSGLALRAPKRRLTLMYDAASCNFAVNLIKKLDKIPDVSNVSPPLSIARAIADEATKGLEKYSRYLGRNPDGRGTLEAHALLPEAVWSLFPCREKEELRTWAASQVEAGGLVPVQDVLERLEGARPDKVGKHQLIGVADALARLGVGMAPDPRFALQQPRYGGPVVLFHLPGDIGTIENPSEAYRNAIVSLAVGALVAYSDGRIDASEREYLAFQIDSNQSVTESEQARLHANLTWMTTIPPDMSRLGNRLRNATKSTREALGRLAVAVAGADGARDPEKIRTIERLYDTMGLERKRVYSDLHAFSPAAEPVTVRRADLTAREFTIPSRPRGNTVMLDEARVSAIKAATADVSLMLNDIFADDEDDDTEIADDAVPDEDMKFRGLDMPHRAVALVLVTRNQWTEEQVAALADEHQLMVAGALETINEWAYERLGDALIEQYDRYEVNGNLAQELKR